jgi:hypothetical protein
MHTETCQRCYGSGVVGEAEHDPNCDGSCRNCPVEVPYPCSDCDGRGAVLIEDAEDGAEVTT